ncbi:TetR/AcrR family transcriptional regulator [Devosia sp.]|uniref:TetR/AcrR family transcriptional regulator n=1 Tax=Devosia sp. TaxID=1871048 RepID=UPI003BAC9D1E
MENRRQEILDGALEVFLQRGFDGATMAAIRERSGASTGSIYHFFNGKAEMAAALLEKATLEWSLRSRDVELGEDAERSIKASVAGFLIWGQENPRLFAFMDDLLARSRVTEDFGPVADMLNSGRRAAGDAYARWVSAKLVQDLPWDVAYALIMGPAYAILRNSAGGRIPDDSVAQIVRSAWLSVRQQ